MKTTAKDFEKFKGYCRGWIEFLGMKDYLFTYHHKSIAKHAASVRANSLARSAAVTLMKDWGVDAVVTDEELNRTALHEVLHVLLNHLVELGLARFGNRDEIDAVEEAAVVRLENAVFECSKWGRKGKG